MASAEGQRARAERARLAERIRGALLEHALAVHEDAGVRGLCSEGRWDAVVSALRAFDLDALLGERTSEPPRDAD
jgi:hypothetical protein